MDSINPDDRDVPLFSIIYQTISMIYWILTGTGARRVNNLSFTLISRNYLDSVQEQLEWNYTNSNFLLTFFFLYTIYSILNFTTKRKTNRNRRKIRFFPGLRKKRRRRKECRERHAKRVHPTWSNKLTKDQDAKKERSKILTRERHGNNFPATTSNNFHTASLARPRISFRLDHLHWRQPRLHRDATEIVQAESGGKKGSRLSLLAPFDFLSCPMAKERIFPRGRRRERK